MKDSFNLIDLLSVMYYLLFLFATKFETSNNFLVILRFCRCILIFRILKMCRNLVYIKFILKVMRKSFSSFFNQVCIFIVMLLFFSLIGRQLFQDYFINTNEEYFIVFSNSFMTVFQIITLDNWYTILSKIKLPTDQQVILAIFILSVIVIGNFLFLNLFLAIIIEAFQSQNFEAKEKSKEEKINTFGTMSPNSSTKTPNLSKGVPQIVDLRRKALTINKMIYPKLESTLKTMNLNNPSSSSESSSKTLFIFYILI